MTKQTIIALMRVIRAAESDKPKLYFLLGHAQGVARHEGVSVIIPFLRLAELNLNNSYRLRSVTGIGPDCTHDAMQYAAKIAYTCLDVILNPQSGE